MAATHMPIPGQPHPDVFIAEGVLRNLGPGETIAKETIAAALNMPMTDWAVIYRRVKTAAHRLCVREGINIAAARGVGYYRELPGQTVARVDGKERPGIRRKAHKSLLSLANLDVARLTSEEQHTYHAVSTIVGITHQLAREPARQKVLTAVKVSRKQLPMASAIEVLRDGGRAAKKE